MLDHNVITIMTTPLIIFAARCHRVATLDAAPLMSAVAPEEEAAPAKREMTPRREHSKKYAASVEEAAKIDKRKPWF